MSGIQPPRGSVLRRTQLSSLNKFRSQLHAEQQQQEFQNQSNHRGLSNRSQLHNRNTNIPLQSSTNMNRNINNRNTNNRIRNRNNNNNNNNNWNNNNNNNQRMSKRTKYENNNSNNNSFHSENIDNNPRISRQNSNKENNTSFNRRRNRDRSRSGSNSRNNSRNGNRNKSRTRNVGYKKPMTLNEAKEKVKSLRKQVSEINEVNERLNEEKEDLELELSNINEKHSFEYENFNNKINSLQTEKQNIYNENISLSQDINRYKNEINLKTNEISMIKSNNNSLNTQLSTIQQSILMKDQILNNNKNEIDSLKTNNNLLTQQITNYKTIEIKYNNCEILIKKLREENMTISLKNTSLNNVNENQLNKIRELQSEINKHKSEINFNYQRIETLQNENNSLTNHKNILTNENNKQIQIINSQRNKINELNTKCEWYDRKSRSDEAIRKKLHNEIQELKGNIRVFCRVRPLISSELKGNNYCYEYKNDDIENQQITLLTPNIISNISGKLTEGKKYNFNFDRVFKPNIDTQESVFNEISQLVQSALDGYKVCIFAYGQTGSGKTYTMEGPSLNKNDMRRGMIPRSVEQIFQRCNKLKDKGWKYKCNATYLEIYNEKIRDLLLRNNNYNNNYNNNNNNNNSEKYLDIHQRKNSSNNKVEVFVEGLTSINVYSPVDVYPLLSLASSNRSVGKTDCNERSSRSHSVFQLFLNGYNEITKQNTFGVLNLIDLAGSERLKKSNATGVQLKETQNINKSLSCLGDVIAALSSKKNRSHIPYRNSKLTYLLMNYFGGDAKTLMFVNLCPGKDKIDESLCSLRFAAKVNDCHIGIAKRTVAM